MNSFHFAIRFCFVLETDLFNGFIITMRNDEYGIQTYFKYLVQSDSFIPYNEYLLFANVVMVTNLINRIDIYSQQNGLSTAIKRLIV